MTNKTSHAFVLKSIRLQNFTTFNDVVFTPESHGLTGIVGSNGSGKSSLMEALLFALYGVTPDKKELVRRNTVPAKGNTTSVTVVFTHAGQNIQVIREISGTNHKVTAYIYVDGEQATNITGTTAAAWIINRLGIDANGFKTAVVVPQDELNDLISLLPSKRRERIEKLAGIENYNVGVARARKVKNLLAAHVNAMPGNPDDLAEAEAASVIVADTVKTLELELDSALILEKSLQEQSQKKTSTYASKVEEYRLNSQRAIEYKNILDRLNNLQQAEQNNVQYLSKFDLTSIDGEGLDRNALRASYVELNDKIKLNIQKLNNHQSLTNAIEQAKSNSKSRLEYLDAAINQKKTVLVLAQDALELLKNNSENKDLLNSFEAVSARVTGRSEEINVIASGTSSLNKSIKAIQETIDDAACPTCHATLNDPQALINEFNGTILAHNNLINSLNEQNIADESILSNIRNLQKEIDNQANALSQQEQQLDYDERNFTSVKNEFEKELSNLQEQFANNFEGFVPDNVVEENNAFQSKIQDITLQGEKAKQFEENKATIENIQSELEKNRNEIEAVLKEIEENENNARVYSQEELSSLFMSNSNLQDELNYINSELNAARKTRETVAINLAGDKQKLVASNDNVERERRLLEQKKGALEQLSIKTNVANLLESGRLHQIGRIAPELSDTATDLISQMTNGRYIQIKVTTDFDVLVTDREGKEYTLGMLSGGEKAIIALALRISIANLITGEDAGLLWLDEVLPAQDPVRREAILQVIRNLPIQQVVMINHTHDAEDIVDKVVRVSYDVDGSSLTVDS